MTKDYSFGRFFHPEKSPHTIFDPIKEAFSYYPKHPKRRGRVVWDSLKKGTYIRAKHGELK